MMQQRFRTSFLEKAACFKVHYLLKSAIVFKIAIQELLPNKKLSTGSHVVGSIPLQALIKAADYYIEKEKVFLIKEQQKIRFIIDRLGLNSVSEFKPESKVRNPTLVRTISE